MAQELAAQGSEDARAPGSLALRALASNPHPLTIEAARSAAAGTDLAGAVAGALALARDDLSPVPRDRAARARWAAALDERLRKLALKIAPAMSVDQGRPWRDVMVDALADLPAMVSLTAAKRALHRPMQFINQVETVVREIAAEVIVERNAILKRLEAMQAEIARAANAQPAIAARAEVDRSTPQEIRDMTPSMRRMGLAAGFLTQVEIDDALSAQGDRVAPPRPVTAAPEPTATDYVAQGLSMEDAAAAVAERERILRRSPAKPIGGQASAAAASAIITSQAA